MALKNADSGSTSRTHQKTAPGVSAPDGSWLWNCQVVTPMLSRLSRAVPALKTQIVRNLPRTISSRAAGLMSSVSMVPRSFSPAHTSTAGYSAPASDHITSMNGKILTIRSNSDVAFAVAVVSAVLGSRTSKTSS